jgi:anti-sigma factor RsiW
MHNCKATKEALLDLLCDEASLEAQARLKVDLNECAACRAEYASLCMTLSTVERSVEASRPSEDFWTGYETRMAQRLHRPLQGGATSEVSGKEQSFAAKAWRAFLAPVRVPIPIAAAFVLLLGVSTYLAVRARESTIVSPTVQGTVETRNVPVPVIQERVVTRVVYVNRNLVKRHGGGTPNYGRESQDPTRTVEPSTGAASASSLAGFRPIDQLKLTVIKGSDANEK